MAQRLLQARRQHAWLCTHPLLLLLLFLQAEELPLLHHVLHELLPLHQESPLMLLLPGLDPAIQLLLQLIRTQGQCRAAALLEAGTSVLRDAPRRL